jgi:adenosine deaminase
MDSIRGDALLLRQFLTELPKGAELHIHTSGALYAERIIQLGIQQNLYISGESFQLYKKPEDRTGLVSLRAAVKNSSFYEAIVRGWSMFNFKPLQRSANDHFFGVFGKFRPALTESDPALILSAIRTQAARDNILYIEPNTGVRSFNEQIRRTVASITVQASLTTRTGILKFHKQLSQHPDFQKAITGAAARLEELKRDSDRMLRGGPGANVDMRFLYGSIRVTSLKSVLAQLITAFSVASRSPLVVGINIMGPENHPTSRKDYSTHMKMIAILSQLYTAVKQSLHAGELYMGQTDPADLRFHIREAVTVAGAERIGHGTAIAYEDSGLDTLTLMRSRGIAVEIPLTSNELLLGVKGKSHPLPTYLNHSVPIVICTDDPGIFRTDMTNEYVMAVTRYPQISYSILKQISRNSIQYSFLEKTARKHLLRKLEHAFEEFEKRWKEYSRRAG